MDDSQTIWDKRFVELAETVGLWSKDRDSKVGCVVAGPANEIRTTGFNGFPRGVRDGIGLRHERPAKYLYTEHAERNAIYNAARVGIPLKDCTLYWNFEPRSCCCDCARAIIQSGIKKVVGPDVQFPSKGKDWEEHFMITEQMFKEAGITTLIV